MAGCQVQNSGPVARMLGGGAPKIFRMCPENLS